MKKILILANSSVGLYKFRLELIEELIKLNFKVFFSLPENYDEKYVNRIESTGAKYIQIGFIRNKINVFSDIKLIIRYILLLYRLKPDVILTYTIKPNIYGSIAAKFFKLPVLINITGLGNAFNKELLRKLIILLYKIACRVAKYVFFQNEHNRDFFISNSIVKSSKAILIPGSGINLEKFVTYEKDYSGNFIKFVFIGRVMKEKGIEEYLNVAQKITAKYSNVKFFILGDLEDPVYSTYIKSVNNERIEYVGFVDDVQEFLKVNKIDCIIHPSYHEGMSNVLLEAAAMGLPIIAFNIPGCKEVVIDKKNGFLVNPMDENDLYNKVEIFIKLDSTIKKEMALYSRKHVEKYFDRNIVVNSYLKCINNLI